MVICVDLQPFPPPVLPQTAGLCCRPFWTNTCSMPTWCPAMLCLKARQRFPSFQGVVRGRISWAPRPPRFSPPSEIVRYRPPFNGMVRLIQVAILKHLHKIHNSKMHDIWKKGTLKMFKEKLFYWLKIIVILYIKYLPNLTFLDSSNEMWNTNTKIACHLHHFLINKKKKSIIWDFFICHWPKNILWKK